MSNAKRSGNLSHTTQLTEEHEYAFWAQVNRETDRGCWKWAGSADSSGYGLFYAGHERIAVARVSWVIEHRKPLFSYQQIRRKRECRTRNCINPAHLRRTGKSYDEYVKSARTPKFSVLRPPPVSASGSAQQKTIHQFIQSSQQLHDFNETLRQLTAAIPEMARKNAAGHNQTHGFVHDFSERLDLFIAEAQKRDFRILRLLERVVARLDDQAEAEVTVAPRAQVSEMPLSSSSSSEEKSNRSLLDAFAQHLGVAVDDEEEKTLQVVFDLALQEAPRASDAIALFSTWLDAFRVAVERNPELAPTPQVFAREVIERRLVA